MVLDKKFGAPLITNDGVTIAKEIELDDPFENMGAQLVKEVSTKTNDVAGDGTTTATLLAQALIREGMKNVAAGANPMGVKKGIQNAVDAAVEAVKANSKKVSGSEDIASVGHHFRGRRHHRQADCRGDGEGFRRRRYHGGGIQDRRDLFRGRRGHAVRPRLYHPLYGAPTPRRWKPS